MPEILKQDQFFQAIRTTCGTCSASLLVSQADLFKVRDAADVRAVWECPVCQTRHIVPLPAAQVLALAERPPRMRAELA